MPTTKDLMMAKCAASGLTPAHVAQLHLVALEPEQIAERYPDLPAHSPAFKIPYHGRAGEPTGFFRLRYTKVLPSFTRPLRYIQPKGTVNQAYFPPLFDWLTAADRDVAVHITEGELKAASATAAGFPCIGLGGVWNFRAEKKGYEILPDLAEFAWEGRECYITFDSDISTNHHVLQAQHALCDQLLRLGAKPRIVLLPDNHPGKTGLDDFLVLEGPDAYRSLCEGAEEWSRSSALHRMNEEVVIVENPWTILNRSTNSRMTTGTFHDIAFAHRTHKKESVNSKGDVVRKEVATSKEWIKWPGRARVHAVTYRPGLGRLLPSQEWNVWPGWGTEPVEGPIDPWRMALDRMFPHDPKGRHWFEQWCAYPLQHPGTKLFTACVFWGTTQGTGKTIVGETLAKIYGRNAVTIGESELHG